MAVKIPAIKWVITKRYPFFLCEISHVADVHHSTEAEILGTCHASLKPHWLISNFKYIFNGEINKIILNYT